MRLVVEVLLGCGRRVLEETETGLTMASVVEGISVVVVVVVAAAFFLLHKTF